MSYDWGKRPHNMALWTSKDWKESWQEAAADQRKYVGTKYFSKKRYAHALAQVHKFERMEKGRKK